MRYMREISGLVIIRIAQEIGYGRVNGPLTTQTLRRVTLNSMVVRGPQSMATGRTDTATS